MTGSSLALLDPTMTTLTPGSGATANGAATSPGGFADSLATVLAGYRSPGNAAAGATGPVGANTATTKAGTPGANAAATRATPDGFDASAAGARSPGQGRLAIASGAPSTAGTLPGISGPLPGAPALTLAQIGAQIGAQVAAQVGGQGAAQAGTQGGAMTKAGSAGASVGRQSPKQAAILSPAGPSGPTQTALDPPPPVASLPVIPTQPIVILASGQAASAFASVAPKPLVPGTSTATLAATPGLLATDVAAAVAPDQSNTAIPSHASNVAEPGNQIGLASASVATVPASGAALSETLVAAPDGARGNILPLAPRSAGSANPQVAIQPATQQGLSGPTATAISSAFSMQATGVPASATAMDGGSAAHQAPAPRSRTGAGGSGPPTAGVSGAASGSTAPASATFSSGTLAPAGTAAPPAVPGGISGPSSRDGNGRGNAATATTPASASAANGPQAAAGGTDATRQADPSQVASGPPGGPLSAADMAAQALASSSVLPPAAADPQATSGAAAVVQALTPPAALAPSVAATATPTASLPTPAAHASPASQVAPALLSLATSTTGAQRITLRLDPGDLGTVQIRIDRAADAATHVEINVSRPETLTLIQGDQKQLQHALDQAGVPAEGRTLSFQLTGQDTGSMSRQTGGSDQSGGNGQSGRSEAGASNAPGSSDRASLPLPTPMRWQRVGLDITA